MKDKYSAITVWFTGLPCIGKTTTARALSCTLKDEGITHRILDSDEVAPFFGSLIESTSEGRDIVARAMALSALQLNLAGVTCLCAATTPRRKVRRAHRNMLPGYVEIWCKGSIETARIRDDQRLYDMAEVGFIQNFTGVDETYEEPATPDFVLDMARLTPEECAQNVIDFIKESRFTSLFSDKRPI